MHSPWVRRLTAGGCALALTVAALWAADPPSPGPDPAARPKRVPWTTSRVTGSPEPPPPYKAVNPFPNVKLDHPVACVFAPGGGRFFIPEQGGKIWSFRNSPDAKPELFADLRNELKRLTENPAAKGFDTLFGMVFHPKFAENRQVFLCYTQNGKKGKTGPFDHAKNLPDGSRVSRFTVTDADPPRLDPASEEILLTFPQGGHNGCDLHFGPDGMLYFCTGDAADPTPPDPFHTGQDVSDLLSSVVRIDVDRKDPGLNYAVPKDNPFVGQTVNGKPARPEVWAYGFRNAWRMSFDRQTGDLFVGDVGWELWEMVHKVGKGTNHGWSVKEATQSVHPDEPLGPTPIVPPLIALSHSDAASVTGGFVYRGKKFPELVGQYVFGDWMTRRVWAAKFDGDKLVSLKDLVRPTLRVVAFGQDHAGELFVVDYDAGTLHTLERNDTAAGASSAFPKTLSATGLFADVKSHQPAPGVYPFEPTARQWQDFGTGEYLIALPGTSTVTDHGKPKPLGGNIDWLPFRYHFPADGVLAKTLSLEMERGNPASRKRVETQLLHFDGLFWEAYTYAWRDDGSDADLVPKEGAERVLTVSDPVYSGKREQTWGYNSRAQCGNCHTPWAQTTLAFNPLQLNRPADAGNPLNRLVELGLLTRQGEKGKPPPSPSFTDKELVREKRLIDPHGPAGTLDARARAYLHVNCGHCHRFGGGGSVNFQLHIDANLAGEKRLLDVPPARGTFGLPDPKLIAPGDPHRSTLFYRVAKFGSGRMPLFGMELVDERGVTLLREWIAGMSETTNSAKTGFDSVACAEPLARECGDPNTPPARRQELLATAAKLPPGSAVRDLFDGYLPRTGERKLGTSPRPATVLAKTGDPARGKELYWNAQRLNCHTCHQIDGKGQNVGPDLSAVGKQRGREHILESILEPSKVIEPAHQNYLLKAADGQTLSGLLVSRDAAGVTIKDAQGKVTTVPKDDVEKLSVAKESLMPAALIADLTAQEAADLVAYLTSRTGGAE